MRCMFTYSWDALTGAGSAQLLGINGSMLALTLYLEPEVGKVRFTSNIQPTRYAILGNPIYLKKVVLEIHESGETAAALFFNTNDALVQATTNFNTASL